MDVKLEWHEVVMASEIGRYRQLASIKRGLADKHGFSGDGWSEHVEGACGEMVVAKHLGVYWDGGINTFKEPDLPGIQVRTRSRHSFDLIVRPDDSDTDQFVLVTGHCPSYRIRGWILGRDAKKPEHLKDHGGRPPAYFVPAELLLPTHSLGVLRAVQNYKLT
jgi:hypothetical protein